MRHLDANALRQSNGYVGEKRTAGIVARHFLVLKKSVDSDGADFVLGLPIQSVEHERERAKGIPTFAVVQAKFFERGTTVYVNPSYAIDDGGARSNFFLFLHTDDEHGEHIKYFLTAEEVISLPTGENGLKRFSLTAENDRSEFRERTIEQIIALMHSGMEAYHDRCTTEYFEKVTLPLRMRSSSNARELRTEYLLMRISLPCTPIRPEDDDERVVFARSANNSVTRPLDARWDLFQTTGTWNWGGKGEGSKLLAMSILAHYLGWDAAPTHEQQMAFLLKVVAKLDKDRDHVVIGEQIEAALSGLI